MGSGDKAQRGSVGAGRPTLGRRWEACPLSNPIPGCLEHPGLSGLTLGSGHIQCRKAARCTYPVNILKPDCSRSDQRSVTSNNLPIHSGTSLNYIRLVQGTNHHASCDQPSQQPGIHPVDCNVLFIVVCLVTLIKGLQGSLVQLVQ